MKLYPPFNKWHVEVKNNAAFESYSRLWKDGGVDGLEGEENEKGFRIVKQYKYVNTFHPQIHGVYHFDESGRKFITFTIESQKHFLFLIISILVMLLTYSFYRQNPQVLFAILPLALFYYLIGWLFHLSEIKEIKKKLEVVIERAKNGE